MEIKNNSKIDQEKMDIIEIWKKNSDLDRLDTDNENIVWKEKRFSFKRIPKKILCLSIVLIILGIKFFTLIFIAAKYLGFIYSICFIILTIILLIPGIFYAYKTIKLGFTQDYEERQLVLREIPMFF